MSKVIAFSGGVYSGKTTTLKALKLALEKVGKKVVMLDELIRITTDKPIDKLRLEPSEYFHIQEKIITQKMKQERMAFNDASDTIYLLDRSIYDSLFYLRNYVDTCRLTESELASFYKLHSTVTLFASYAALKYDSIYVFYPLHSKREDDKFRPRLLNDASMYEYHCIRTLVKYSKCDKENTFKYFEVDLNRINTEQVINFIVNEYRGTNR